jgi:CheY-like chemotaxis protein
MAHILVVDDSAADRILAGRLLEKDGHGPVRYAVNGLEALAHARLDRPDIIVSDLQMPEMDGLQLVEQARDEFPSIPVVLMTAKGSEEIAAEALRKGAAGYVPKMALSRQLTEIVQRIVNASGADRLHTRLMHALAEDECCFRFTNDPELFDALVAHFQQLLRCIRLRDEAARLRAGVAVRAALWIAHHHGNLEIPIDPQLSDDAFNTLAEQRRWETPYATRSIEFRAKVNRERAEIIIHHEGPGVDLGLLPSNVEGLAADRSWLGGFLVIPAIMDEVRYAADGHTITLTKHSRASQDNEELEFSEE